MGNVGVERVGKVDELARFQDRIVHRPQSQLAGWRQRCRQCARRTGRAKRHRKRRSGELHRLAPRGMRGHPSRREARSGSGCQHEDERKAAGGPRQTRGGVSASGTQQVVQRDTSRAGTTRRARSSGLGAGARAACKLLPVSLAGMVTPSIRAPILWPRTVLLDCAVLRHRQFGDFQFVGFHQCGKNVVPGTV